MMNTTHSISVLMLSAISIGACHRTESTTVDAAPDIDAAKVCTMDSDCGAPTPACDTVANPHACVPCLLEGKQDIHCAATAPVCAAQTCRACAADAECSSGVCRADGTCEAATDVIYVSTAGTGAACTAAVPCNLAMAQTQIGTPRRIVHLAPGVYAYTTPMTLSFDTRVSIVGRGAEIDRQAAGIGPVITIGSNGIVVIEFLKITGGDGAIGDGINASGGTVTVTGATVTTNQGAGINASGGTVTVTGATVTANNGGGLDIKTSVVKLVNNFIIRNGNTSTTSVGGIGLTSVTGQVEFNTIADNDASVAGVGGVSCSGLVVGIANSIITNNRQNGSSAGATAQVSVCTVSTSAVLASSATILFKNATVVPFNYHLNSGSAAIDAATTTSNVTTDIDGDLRPTGAGKDQGADEFKP
jgi:hypothetical protein